MSIGPRYARERRYAAHHLETALNGLRATKAERTQARRLFNDLAEHPNRGTYDQLVKRATDAVVASRGEPSTVSATGA